MQWLAAGTAYLHYLLNSLLHDYRRLHPAPQRAAGDRSPALVSMQGEQQRLVASYRRILEVESTAMLQVRTPA